MKNLGDQWIELIDGAEHMLKAVNYSEGCNGCIFLRYDPDEFYTCNRGRLGCPVDDGMIIKDLGILNEDGCLPSSWGGYPEVIRVGKPNFVTYFKVSLVVKYGDGSGIQVHVTGKTRQQAIDAWNRRA